MTSRLRKFAPAEEVLAPLWVTGLALIQIFLASLLLPYTGSKYAWAQYMLLGTLYPALIIVLIGAARATAVKPVLRWLRMILAAACPVFTLIQLVGVETMQQTYLALGLALVVAVVDRARRSLIQEQSVARQATCFLAVFLVSAVSWVVAERLLWWRPITIWLQDSRHSFVVFCTSLALVSAYLFQNASRTNWLAARWERCADAIGMLVIALASFRAIPLSWVAHHHWGVLTGPAELVREGGWLLWDVPFQYGFLSTLTVAWLPTANVWQSFYVVNSTLTFLAAAFLFTLLRSLRPGVISFVLSLALTLAAFFLIPGFPQLVDGNYPVPNVGPFRFFWCYALLALLLAHHRWSRPDTFSSGWLWAGCLIWLLGSLWSSESAVYCAVIWIPAFFLLVLRRTFGRAESTGTWVKARALAAWMALPLLLLICVFCAITAYYIARLGHAPDWYCFVEYSLTFSSGVGALPIDAQGAVWSLLLVFVAVSTAIAYFLHRGTWLELPPLLAGAWGAVWATASYYVGRSHESNATNLSPLLCVAVGSVLCVQNHWALLQPCRLSIRLTLAPVLCVLLTGAFGNETRLRDYARACRSGFVRHMERRLPVMPPALDDLLQTAQVRKQDPIFFVDDHSRPLCVRWNPSGPELVTHRHWLPSAPLALFIPLGDDRKEVFVSRYVARTHLSGWLIQSKHQAEESYAEARRALPQAMIMRHHVPDVSFENDEWIITWCKCVAQ